MAIQKITENVEIHQTLGDNPNTDGEGMTAQELKKAFDMPARVIKAFINEQIAPNVLDKRGDSLKGSLNAAGFQITGLPAPSTDKDAVPKIYVDNGLAQKAPVGYTTRSFDEAILAGDDFDNYTDGGIYGVNSDNTAGKIANCPIAKAGRLIVEVAIALDDTWLGSWYRRQVYETINGYRVRRMLVSTDKGASWTLGPWEWEIAPMEVGVEYRTTERHQGYPVYTMQVNCGTTVAGSIEVRPFNTAITPVRPCEGFLTKGTATSGYRIGLPFITIGENGVANVYAHAYAASDKVAVGATSGFKDYTAYVQVWYVKEGGV